MEGLVLPGAKFVLNVLGGDKVGPVTKQLLKPFAPGEERFGGLGTEESSACGGARVLKDAVRLGPIRAVDERMSGTLVRAA